MFEWAQVVGRIFVDGTLLTKKYGVVQRGGKTFYRNYGRELKNGKGVSIADRMLENVTKNNALLQRLMAQEEPAP